MLCSILRASLRHGGSVDKRSASAKFKLRQVDALRLSAHFDLRDTTSRERAGRGRQLPVATGARRRPDLRDFQSELRACAEGALTGSEDDNEREHYLDSGGKSGGQKEALAYTMLVASLAYQFGLEWGAVHSRLFRFVVIDESFGRGSDASAQCGLRLFAQLNLQLLIVTSLQKIHILEPFPACFRCA